MTPTLELTTEAAARIRLEISRADGREVCFVASIDELGGIVEPRAVARGSAAAVLAAVREATPGMLVIHNHPSGELSPSDPDLSVGARLHAAGLGLAITDNDAARLYVVVEPPRPAAPDRLDAADVVSALAPGGPVAVGHSAYEDRPTQRDMAAAIAAAYSEGRVALAEAGTGTGKSIAYLVPAILWAARNRQRTVVSTNTINLQEQLVGKDLPLLRASLGTSFRYALVKGRANYISIRRAKLAAAGQASLFEGPESAELPAIVAWLETTRDGSLQDLAFTPSPAVWDEVASESDVCLRTRCPHYEQCFYQKARRDAATADVLVVNHALLFTDLAVRRNHDNYTSAAVLPPYRRVVLDEAHNLEDAATSHLGARVTRRGVLRLLSRLERRGRGLLPTLDARLENHDAFAAAAAARIRLAAEVRPAVDAARGRMLTFFDLLESLAARADDGVLRLPAGFTGEPAWTDGPGPALEAAAAGLERLAAGLGAVHRSLAGEERLEDTLADTLLELEAAANRVGAAADSLRFVFSALDEPVPMVRWLEHRGAEGREAGLSAHAAPVDLSHALRDALFDRVDTAVLTSATLATRDGFGFLRQRLGLGGGLKVDEAVYPSPFDFERQALVLIPTDLPLPDVGPRRTAMRAGPGTGVEPEAAEAGSWDGPPADAGTAVERGLRAGRAIGRMGSLDTATATVVEDMAAASDGGIFVLFTSYRALRSVAGRLRRGRTADRWPLFVQGEAQRDRLVRGFAASGRGILLGVTSFWEGVDVPGEPLRGLIIQKLPFRVPGEPLTAARLEAIEAEGGSAFYEYLLPHAALRLKQGFGRLIRTRTDRGAVVLLDRRILERGYGRYFLDSLPPAPIETGTWPELAVRLRDFYGKENGQEQNA